MKLKVNYITCKLSICIAFLALFRVMDYFVPIFDIFPERPSAVNAAFVFHSDEEISKRSVKNVQLPIFSSNVLRITGLVCSCILQKSTSLKLWNCCQMWASQIMILIAKKRRRIIEQFLFLNTCNLNNFLNNFSY